MAEGFRKSFFGFNCDDVIEYIKKTHKDFSDKETEFNQKKDELSSELSAAKRRIGDLESENAALQKSLDEYREREEDICRIAENIGKLYIVSRANASAVIESAEENLRISREEVQRNIEIIRAAHEALSKISKGVSDSSSDFTESIKRLSDDLELTCKKIENNDTDCDDNSEKLRLIKENLA